MQDLIEIDLLAEDEEFVPRYASESSAGCDVRACINQDIIIAPHQTVLIPTGIKVAIPHGYEIQVRPRSGLALKHSITVLNTPGTIDADYRGEIGVILINHGKDSFTVQPKMRIAQLVVAKVYQAKFLATSQLTSTLRGEGGFGHSGSY